jgi:hypothetical protein
LNKKTVKNKKKKDNPIIADDNNAHAMNKKKMNTKVDYINNSMERSYADPVDSDTDDEDGVMELLGKYTYVCIYTYMCTNVCIHTYVKIF